MFSNLVSYSYYSFLLNAITVSLDVSALFWLNQDHDTILSWSKQWLVTIKGLIHTRNNDKHFVNRTKLEATSTNTRFLLPPPSGLMNVAPDTCILQ